VSYGHLLVEMGEVYNDLGLRRIERKESHVAKYFLIGQPTEDLLLNNSKVSISHAENRIQKYDGKYLLRHYAATSSSLVIFNTPRPNPPASAENPFSRTSERNKSC
jgi:hypothetical protein